MIDIEQLQAGMVVKIDVRDRSGRLLLGGGTKHFQQLLTFFFCFFNGFTSDHSRNTYVFDGSELRE